MRFVRSGLTCGLVALGVLGTAGGSTAQSGTPPAAAPASEAEMAQLKERAATFWAARVSGDSEAQWKLLEPRGKGRVTAQEYGAAPTGGRYLAYQVEGATVNGFFATVKVRLVVQQLLQTGGPTRPLPPQAVIVEDGWIKIGGLWYRRLEDGQKAASDGKQP